METTLEPSSTVQAQQKPARAKHDDTLREEVKALYITGVQPHRIQALKGVKTTTVQTWANRHGWIKLRDSLVQHIDRAVDTSVSDAVQKRTEQIHKSVVGELESTVQTLTKTKHSKTLDHVGQRVSIIERAASAGQKLGLWGQEQSSNQALTLLCLSSTDSLSQGLARPIEVESTVQPGLPQPAQVEQNPQQNQAVQDIASTGTEQAS